MGSDRGIMMEVEGVWNLGGIGVLSCIRAGIRTLVCVLVLVVEVVMALVVVLVWMILMVWVVVGVLVLATLMVQEVLVEAVSGSSSGGLLVVLVILDGFELVLWSGWWVVLRCWNERGCFLGRFSLKLVAGNMSVAEGACLFGMVIWSGFLDHFDFFDFLELMEEVEVLVWWRWPEA